MTNDTVLRELLARVLSWEDAHAGFETAVRDLPVDLRGAQPAGLPYSPWQMLEHLRITQHDILDFCINPDYKEIAWPKEYWPSTAVPPSEAAWDDSVAAFLKDREALAKLAADTSIELDARIPHGSGQTCLRELILAADHTAYHVGQLVLIRRLLGSWK
jgi:DinB family protein